MYETFYKLRASPFQLAPDPAFFYDSGTHRRGLVKLRQVLDNGTRITTVTGDAGTGKTELMAKFVKELDSNSFVVAKIPLTGLRANNILDYIAAAFGVVNMGFVGDALWSKQALLRKIQQQVISKAGDGKKFIVLIDNAESLTVNSLEKLIQLCNLKNQGVAPVQCFLFGENPILDMLTQQTSNDLLLEKTTIQLGALGEDDVRNYVEHRLIEAGWLGEPEITDSAYKLIYEISEGIPWHINLLCHRVFLQGFLEDTHKIDMNLVSIFRQEVQLHNYEVSGSDIARPQNVVSLNSYSDSWENREQPDAGTKSEKTPKIISEHLENSRELANAPGNYKLSDANDPESISMIEVESAFDACLGEINNQGGNIGGKQQVSPELANCFETQEISEPLKSRRERDILLDRILPGAMTNMENNIQQFQKTRRGIGVDERKLARKIYPILSVPNSQINSDQVGYFNNGYFSDFTNKAGKSSMQIAMSASIVTSLIITLVMWVVSDTRTYNTQLVQSTKSSNFEPLDSGIPGGRTSSVSPNPFENPNDVARARVLSK